MELGLKDKAVLVMASSTGLGKAMATEFAVEGANVLLFSRSEETLKKTRDEIAARTGREPVYVQGDITRYEDIKEAVRTCVGRFGSVDVLVNNGGGPPAGTFDSFGDEAWQKAYELTLLSFIRSIREVLPHMRRQGQGWILNSTSSSVKAVLDNLLLSNTFRMGVMGLTKTLSQELAKDNILINVIAPGKIDTDRLQSLDAIRAGKQGVTVEAVRAQTEKQIPLGRYGTPEEYAKLAVFLCSPQNTYITGQAVLVDGGLLKAY